MKTAAALLVALAAAAATCCSSLGCSSDGGSDRKNRLPRVELERADADPATGIVTVHFRVIDHEGDRVTAQFLFSTDGGATQAGATILGGSDGVVEGNGLRGLDASRAGTDHVASWDSFADGVGLAGPADVLLTIHVFDRRGERPGRSATLGFDVDNVGVTP